jgi:outer membrane protein, adhesin transport system
MAICDARKPKEWAELPASPLQDNKFGSDMRFDRRLLLGKLALPGSICLVLVLGACANTKELAAISASLDVPLEQSRARIAASPAAGEFGVSVRVAVETHPQLAASNASVRAAQARADAESRNQLPTLSFGATVASLNNGGVTGLISPLLQVTQLVFDGGDAASRRVGAKARVFEARGERLELASAVALQAVGAWLDLRAARERLRIASENERAHARILSQLEDRAEAGVGANTDVLTARARLATARARAAEARARSGRAESAFAQIFGRAGPAQVGVAPVAPALPAVTEAELIALSPRILGLDARITTARANLERAKAGRSPEVTLQGAAQRGGGSADVDVRYQPGAPGSKAALIRAAEADLDALRAERVAMARDIERALADLRTDQRAGAARVQAAREAVRAHRATVDASREEFSIGRRSLLGLLDAERDLFDASETLIAAEREVALSGYAALALTGDILDAFAVTLPVSAP